MAAGGGERGHEGEHLVIPPCFAERLKSDEALPVARRGARDRALCLSGDAQIGRDERHPPHVATRLPNAQGLLVDRLRSREIALDVALDRQPVEGYANPMRVAQLAGQRKRFLGERQRPLRSP